MAFARPAAGNVDQAVLPVARVRQADRLLRAQRQHRNHDPQSVKRETEGEHDGAGNGAEPGAHPEFAP
jgi:hypothetical protein